MSLSRFPHDSPRQYSHLPMRPGMMMSDRSSPSLGMTDFVETDTELVLKSDAPGMTKEDIKVQILDGNTLSITGEHDSDEEQPYGRSRRVEHKHCKFTQTFPLPENVDTSRVSATLERGRLRVTLPKLSPTTQRRNFNVHIQ